MTRAEALTASLAAAPAAAMLVSYFPLHAGWQISPRLVLAAAVVATALIAGWFGRRLAADRGGVMVIGILIVAVFAALLAIAWPELLPVGSGTDLAHHLVLINHLERFWRLVSEPALYPYLGDMLDYTPGSHLLIALAGAWSGSDGIHAAHPVLAATVAIKIGMIACLARRVVGIQQGLPFACAASLMPFASPEYVLGSFTIHSFWAQTVSELFAIAAWWALTAWDDQPRPDVAMLFALFGSAVFLAWPIWLGPVALSAAVIIAVHERMPLRRKLIHLTIALAPVAIVAAVHSIGKLGRLQMAGTSGAVVRPSIERFGIPFLLAAAVGLFALAISRRGRTTLVFAAAIGLQAAALSVAARRSGADTPYMALKMLYLAPYPMAVGASLALATVFQRGIGRLRVAPGAVGALAWVVAAAVAIGSGVRVAAAPRPKPVVAESTLAAGRWARTHVDRACVDYLVADGFTGYWLHLAVLDNPRDTARFNDPDTFEPDKAFARWIDPEGLPYAIVDDVNGFSRALFNGTETVARFDRSLVIRRLGRSSCPK
jgi:MFS family permease